MHLTINGAVRELDDAHTLAHVLQQLEVKTSDGGVAVAVNDRVVPRARWESTPVGDGDRVEIIHAVQGG
jgi:sulfur carrier protein